MIKRLITGICYVAVIVGFFFLRKIDNALFLPLIYAFSIIGTFEMLNSFGDKVVLSQKITLIVYAIVFTPVYYLVNTLWPGEGKGTMLICSFCCSVALLIFLVIDKNTTLENVGCSLICGIYPTAMLGTMILANDLIEYSTLALLLIFIISPAADTCAYVVGSLLKGKKLCPEISPNKTVSGAIGGAVGGTLACILLYVIFEEACGVKVIPYGINPWLFFVLVGLICSIITEFGDLVESVIKRKLGVKDMGKLLPGHGGILDRIDGTIFASLFIYIVFAIFIV